MMDYAWDFSQSETEKYFKWIMTRLIGHSYWWKWSIDRQPRPQDLLDSNVAAVQEKTLAHSKIKQSLRWFLLNINFRPYMNGEKQESGAPNENVVQNHLNSIVKLILVFKQ